MIVGNAILEYNGSSLGEIQKEFPDGTPKEKIFEILKEEIMDGLKFYFDITEAESEEEEDE